MFLNFVPIQKESNTIPELFVLCSLYFLKKIFFWLIYIYIYTYIYVYIYTYIYIYIAYIKVVNTYYQKYKERLRKEAHERYQNLTQEEKDKRQKKA